MRIIAVLTTFFFSTGCYMTLHTATGKKRSKAWGLVDMGVAAVGTGMCLAGVEAMDNPASWDSNAHPSDVREEASTVMIIGCTAAVAFGASGFYGVVKGEPLSERTREILKTTATVALIAAVVVGTAMATSKAGGSTGGGNSADSCTANERATAVCNDGTYSCAKKRQGQCAWHGGVDYYL